MGVMQTWRLQSAAIERFHRQAQADRWGVQLDVFATALERSARRAFPSEPEARELERYLASLHLQDMALACACGAGHAAAWEHFVREYRPALYRSADAIDPTGGARDLADSLYGELFGLSERDGERRSHLQYFHGRSSLGTWLRAVLSQRHVDRVRSVRRLEPLPSDEAPGALPSPAEPEHPARPAYLDLIQRAFSDVVARLAPKDRLRLRCYYAQDLTLAQIGGILNEHEATASRNLARTRREIRADVERHLRDREGMSEARISECFASVAGDSGSLDMTDLLGADHPPGQARKERAPHRSRERREGTSA